MANIQKVITEALANARGMRHGVPPISNILEALPSNIKEQVLSDAEEVIKALKRNKLL